MPNIALAAALALGLVSSASVPVYASEELSTLLLDPPRTIRPFELQRAGRQSFANADLVDKWSVVFFGYTNCPDVCPLVLNDLADGIDRLAARGVGPEAPRIVFVGVDPSRDTPDILQAYVANFGPNFIGVTGEIEDVIEFARQFGAGSKVGRKLSHGRYMVSHTAVVFFVDPAGRIVAKLSPPVDPEQFADRFAKLHAHFEQVSRAP